MKSSVRAGVALELVDKGKCNRYPAASGRYVVTAGVETWGRLGEGTAALLKDFEVATCARQQERGPTPGGERLALGPLSYR
ncbi:hypothetical protein N9L68_08260 [bacterium]|nr:hypothetical protein [bacterium]